MGLFKELGRLYEWSREASLDIITFGGNGKLNETKQAYDRHLAMYKDADASLRDAIAKLNIQATNSASLNKEARAFVERLPIQSPSTDLVGARQILMPSLKGVGPIIGLERAVSTNSILAWFGAGVLVAGGGSAALGGSVLAWITFIPVMAFMAFKARRKVAELEKYTKRIAEATSSNRENAEKMFDFVKKVDALTAWTLDRNNSFSTQLNALKREDSLINWNSEQKDVSTVQLRQLLHEKTIEVTTKVAQLAYDFANDLSAYLDPSSFADELSAKTKTTAQI